MNRLLACALATWISAAGAQPLVVDGNGDAIGIFLEHLPSPAASGWSPGDVRNLHVASSTGYRFNLAVGFSIVILVPGQGFVPALSAEITGYWSDDAPDESNSRYYESGDCSGQAYLPTNTTAIVAALGSDFGDSEPPELGYIPRNELIRGRQFSSRRSYSDPTICESLNDSPLIFAAAVFPNDPKVSGISSGAFEPPVRIANGLTPAQASCIFQSGFECQIGN
jgi:hypothetical protein